MTECKSGKLFTLAHSQTKFAKTEEERLTRLKSIRHRNISRNDIASVVGRQPTGTVNIWGTHASENKK